ncbi:hypothetical protein BG261_08065 [Floricoccus tropicus]|uniref:bis(5'-nucleosyl)-tetraphosphatase (symmetrical) n=1 Tax=Floricoccus tropicus TaxID=1859473 RepID=A0A1E8GJ11_9LACT|nr:bis(5'-nucleosyl)-tetraphosphatase (symmetrical) YqeK [Floricoccus tropicus]OFI48229.1 hypothetical protein BG261_08065 [Floricoccus tropicus]
MQGKENYKKEIYEFLASRDCISTYEHCIEVGDYAAILANDFGFNEEKALIAGYFHDISAIYPVEERIHAAEEFKINLLPEEKIFPLIIHQKISAYLANNYFFVIDDEILSAIECHTTLKGGYSETDLLVFVADKIKWDQRGIPPYLDKMLERLEESLEDAALYYIQYIMNNDIKILHPWLLKAKSSLEENISLRKIHRKRGILNNGI